ncbi:MAG TPA: glycosyltransferase family 2 protein [Candidatus Saccharimonadales bacterium]|nr:glycosyltransferase family 2 protein [Candidatus Saccharimonadales bacterium]
MSRQSMISIIVPLHNEAPNIQPLYEELLDAIHNLPYLFEFILIDDGSRDDSAQIARSIAKRDPRLRLLEFARNFGKEAAVSAGLHNCKGDAAVIMDADLQHPPALIPAFISKWRRGYEVVVGLRTYDKRETLLKRGCSALYYKIMQKIAHTKITPHATDFRLLDRSVIEAFNGLPERNRMTRGLIDWLGFKRGYVKFKTRLRMHGEVSYTFTKLIGLAINSMTAYTLLPLRLAGYLGLTILAISAPLGAFILVEKYILHDPLGLQFSGPATLAVIILFLVGVMLACMGLVAMYIAHIHAEVLGRPLYVIRPERMSNDRLEVAE